MTSKENQHCAEWENLPDNKKLRKLLGDSYEVDLIRKADITANQKYEHIDSIVSLLDKIREAIAALGR